MKMHPIQTLSGVLFALASLCIAQVDRSPKNASAVVLQAFETHDVVMLGEIHWNKQEYEWLQSLVANPEFADRVDDVVMEFGNSLLKYRRVPCGSLGSSPKGTASLTVQVRASGNTYLRYYELGERVMRHGH